MDIDSSRVGRQEAYFLRERWTDSINLIWFAKLGSARKGIWKHMGQLEQLTAPAIGGGADWISV
jgi:hypothetical protein